MRNFTIIIPIFNEIDSIFNLLDEIKKEFKGQLPEIIIVDDGSTDNFVEKKKEYKENSLKIIHHKKNLGKCRAMLTGVKNAQKKNICIIDGDGQNPPYEAKKLMNFWMNINKQEKQFALVCGNRIKRQDSMSKKISSRVANKIRKIMLDDDCNDTACALKVFSKEDYLKLKYFKNMHRFLPALFKINSGKIFNVPVDDRKRTKGISKYSFHNRFWIGILDLINVWLMILKRRNK